MSRKIKLIGNIVRFDLLKGESGIEVSFAVVGTRTSHTTYGLQSALDKAYQIGFEDGANSIEDTTKLD